MTAVERLPAGPAPDGGDTFFWEGLRNGRLLLPRCGSCGTWRPLGRVLCATCWSFDADPAEVAPRGTIYSWVRTRRAFMPELDVAVPYVTVLVALRDAPVRLLGILVDADPETDPAIGAEVGGVIQHPANADWPVLRWHLAEAA